MKKTISITIDDTVNTKLSSYCYNNCVSKSALFEKFARDFLEELK